MAGVLTEDILSKVKIVDLSADFRIKDVATYEKWYKIEHKSPQFIDEAVYGLCEINRDKMCIRDSICLHIRTYNIHVLLFLIH